MMPQMIRLGASHSANARFFRELTVFRQLHVHEQLARDSLNSCQPALFD